MKRIAFLSILLLVALHTLATTTLEPDSAFNAELESGVLRDSTLFDKIRALNFEAMQLIEEHDNQQAADVLVRCALLNYDEKTRTPRYPKTFALTNYLLFCTTYSYENALYFIPYSVKYDPTNEEYLLILATTYEWYLLQNKPIPVHSSLKIKEKSSIDFAKRLIALNPNKSDYHFILANYYINRGKYKNAIDELSRFSILEGDRLQILTMQAEMTATKLHKPKVAIRMINDFIARNPHLEKEALLIAANIYNTAGLYHNQLSTLNALYENQPNDPDINMALFRYHMSQNNDSVASFHIRKLIFSGQLSPDTACFYLRPLIAELLATGREDRALQLVDSLDNIHPMNTNVATIRLNIAQSISDTVLIINALQRLDQINPYYETPSLELFKIYASQNKSDSLLHLSKRVFLRYANSETTPTPPHISIGVSRWGQIYASNFFESNSDTNITAHRDIIATAGDKLADPDYFKSQIYLAAAISAHRLVCLSRASSLYDSCLIFNPRNAIALNNYAYILVNSGSDADLNKAEKMVLLSLEIDPDETSTLDTYAWILYKRQLYHLSKIYFDKIDRLTKDNYSITNLCHKAFLFLKLNNIDEARALYNKAASLISSSTDEEQSALFNDLTVEIQTYLK